MTILDGLATSLQIKSEIKEAVNQLQVEGKRVPHLAAVLVGDN
ncbi:MAG: bifunctional 5,10-methylene-tetrahydrofolate dehydrogenase/5,10-methylene-tetrahydrofolate cyclohydrolase, partial [Flavobacteriales bacterium]